MELVNAPVKWRRVLTAFLAGRSFNRFQAERPESEGGLSDHCLHSTVSTIQEKGVRISRKSEAVPGYQGIKTECCRYWLDPSDPANVARARELLGEKPEPKPDPGAAERWQRAIRAQEQERRDREQRQRETA
jgi:hypothetical protein